MAILKRSPVATLPYTFSMARPLRSPRQAQNNELKKLQLARSLAISLDHSSA